MLIWILVKIVASSLLCTIDQWRTTILVYSCWSSSVSTTLIMIITWMAEHVWYYFTIFCIKCYVTKAASIVTFPISTFLSIIHSLPQRWSCYELNPLLWLSFPPNTLSFVFNIQATLCLSLHISFYEEPLWPLLLTWFNFNPSMDK